MGEIAESIINGEFDYINGEYIGEPVGHPRTRCAKRHKSIYPFFRQKLSNETRSITNMCNSLGLSEREKLDSISRFLRTKGYNVLPKMNRQYKIIYHQYKEEFKKYIKERKSNEKSDVK